MTLSNATLASLEVDDNDVGCPGLEAFLRALEVNRSMLVATLASCPVEADGVTRLDALRERLDATRTGMNLMSFVTDTHAGDASTAGGAGWGAGRAGLVDMSVCLSFMPSKYRQAGFSS